MLVKVAMYIKHNFSVDLSLVFEQNISRTFSYLKGCPIVLTSWDNGLWNCCGQATEI